MVMPFHESRPSHPGWATPISRIGIQIAGTFLEKVILEFRAELERVGIRRLVPHFYLSNEWGVPFDTTTIAIPFYLAQSDLTKLHADQVGFIEGEGRAELLRYLRHEMGHVVNYGYQLYKRSDWTALFGDIEQDYEEEYRPEPFSHRFVWHLPGWYAQKHPDEDWAETFAVWMTPGLNWRAEYRDWPDALKKLEYCERLITEVKDSDPLITDTSPDEPVDDLHDTLEEFYRDSPLPKVEPPPSLDVSLRFIFADRAESKTDGTTTQPASALIRRLERELMATVFRWTGHFPERTRALLRVVAERADQLGQVYAVDREEEVAVALTTYVTALAMNHVHRGQYGT
jgi:hypothetical protein